MRMRTRVVAITKSSPSAQRDLGEGDREAVEGVAAQRLARTTPSVSFADSSPRGGALAYAHRETPLT